MTQPHTGATDRSVREHAVSTALAFLMAESVRRHSRARRRADMKLMFHLRDSLSYRAEAVAWHPYMIRIVGDSASRRLREVHSDFAKEQQLLFHLGAEHFYLFDDLVFNALSLFDYVGNIVGFAFYGEQRRKAKWDRVQRFAHDAAFERRSHPKPRISPGPVGQAIREVHASLVRALTEYRAALIHYEALLGPGEVTTHFGPDEQGTPGPHYDLRFRVPREFAELFAVPGFEQDRENAPLLKAATWLAEETTRSAVSVLAETERELRVEAGPQSSVEIIA